MNYLWEVMIQAWREGIAESKLRFSIPKEFSAYMEISSAFINQERLEMEQYVEINPYYRFYQIFKDLYDPDYEQGTQLRDSLFNLIMHQLAGNDVRSGMTKEEYYKALLLKDIEEGQSGRLAKEGLGFFDLDEQQVILSGILRLYQTGCSINLFREMMEVLIPDHIIYHNNENTDEIVIYIGKKRTETLDKKLRFLTAAFLNLSGNVGIYYKYHFGIIGVEETMIIDEIALC